MQTQEKQFTFPTIYNLPPFFTIQPVLNTRKKQLQLWCELVLDYVRHYKLFEMDLLEATNSVLFWNKQINRRLNLEGIKLVVEELVERGNAEWVTIDQSRAVIYWRSPVEWSNLIYSYAVNHSMTGTVCTLYELRESDAVSKEEFFELDLRIFNKALAALEQQQKAKVFSSNGNVGVKFL